MRKGTKIEESGIVMKKFVRLISLMLLLCMIFAMPSVAYADKSYSGGSKQDKDSGNEYAVSASELLKQASNYKKIDIPSSSEMFAYFVCMYIDAPKGHSVYVYDSYEAEGPNQFGFAFHGSRVYAVGERDGFVCILYFTEKNEFMAGWVNVDYLNYVYPGEEYTPDQSSRAGEKNTYRCGDPMVSWSKMNFPGTKIKYTVLNSPIEDCVEFTLDYFVTSRNGSSTEAVLGDREIYVYDGKNWIEIGTIDYDEVVPCHIRVTLDKPITLCAVATIPYSNSTTFVYRQSVIDVICKDDGNNPRIKG